MGGRRRRRQIGKESSLRFGLVQWGTLERKSQDRAHLASGQGSWAAGHSHRPHRRVRVEVRTAREREPHCV